MLLRKIGTVAVMQSPVSRIKIFGHWNYPNLEDSDYAYMEKTFNGSFWEENGQIGHRDALHKTVYVIGSYDIAKIVLKVNNQEIGSCDTPINTIIVVVLRDLIKLMDGEPYVSPEGIFIMEINAVVPFIQGVSSLYDEKVNVLRVAVPHQ